MYICCVRLAMFSWAASGITWFYTASLGLLVLSAFGVVLLTLVFLAIFWTGESMDFPPTPSNRGWPGAHCSGAHRILYPVGSHLKDRHYRLQ